MVSLGQTFVFPLQLWLKMYDGKHCDRVWQKLLSHRATDKFSLFPFMLIFLFFLFPNWRSDVHCQRSLSDNARSNKDIKRWNLDDSVPYDWFTIVLKAGLLQSCEYTRPTMIYVMPCLCEMNLKYMDTNKSGGACQAVYPNTLKPKFTTNMININLLVHEICYPWIIYIVCFCQTKFSTFIMR